MKCVKRFFPALLSATFMVISACHATQKPDERISLSVKGKTGYAIAVSPDDLVANTAAKELAANLKEITGAEFPIVKPEQNSKGHVIAVGPGATKTLVPELELAFSKLGNDGIIVKTSGANLILTGADGAKRGTLYAVYEFLEREAGVRWWTSKDTFIPKNPSLEIKNLNAVYVPKLIYRESFYKDVLSAPAFAAHLKSNGHWEKITASYGGHYEIIGWCHTFYRLLPPKTYFKDHPEWYSLLKGERSCGRESQLCLSNDEMRKELTKNALELLRKNPDAGMISISQNDAPNGACECPGCLATQKREGSASGPLIEFVNKVAEDIEKEFPNVYVETLAYHYTRKPPLTVKPRKNVIVRLCSIECSFSQPLETGAQNADFRKDMEAWSAIAPQLLIWDYTTNFDNYLLPHPNISVMAPNIRFFEKNKSIGVGEQGDSGCTCGDFVELKAWLLAKLMWNPSLDENKLIDEFMDGYYGAASKPLKDYLALIDGAVKRQGTYLRCYMPTTPWLDTKDLVEATRLFDKATELAKGDPSLSKKIRKAKMSIDATWLRNYDAMKLAARMSNEPFKFEGPADIKSLCEDFIKSANEFNIGKIAEGVKFKDMEETLKARFLTPSTPPAQCAGLRDDEWFEARNCDFHFYGFGSWVKFAEDAKASGKRAVRMDGSHKEWATQYPFPPVLQGFRCYAVVRCDVKPGGPKKGIAFKAGIHNKAQPKKEGVSITETVERSADGEYRTYDLGVCNLKDGYIWVAPDANPEVDAVYVDRIFFVKEKASK